MKKLLGVLTLLILVTACTSVDPYTGENKVNNSSAGALLGAAAGAAIGSLTGQDREAILTGAAVGAAGGAGVGYYLDHQEKELRRVLQGTGVQVRKVGKSIQLVMPGDITFRTGSASIDSGFYRTLDSVAIVLNKFKKSRVSVAGHTDNVGGKTYNQNLSYNRAQAVSRYLNSRGVSAGRLHAQGFDYSRPVASNKTSTGRARNRRVEIQILPY